MFDSKALWLANNAAVIALYAFAGGLFLQGQNAHWAVILAAIVLVAHVLEIPLAMKALKEKNPSWGRLFVGTVLFGFTWWLPAKKGIYRV